MEKEKTLMTRAQFKVIADIIGKSAERYGQEIPLDGLIKITIEELIKTNQRFKNEVFREYIKSYKERMIKRNL